MRKSPRILIALVFLAVWLAGMALGGPTFGKISEVTTNDQSTFLPASAESTLAREKQELFAQSNQIPATVVAEINGDTSGLEEFATRLSEVEGVDQVIGPQFPEDGSEAAVQYIVLIDADVSTNTDAVAQLRSVEGPAEFHVAGPAGLSADLGSAFAGIDGLLLLVALSVVFVILVLVYRSVLLPVLVLSNAVAALCVAILAVYWMALEEWIVLNGQSQGILSILVIGAATDYSLLLVARHREELTHREHALDAVWAAIKGSFGAISASAATVALALLCLLFTDLNSNRSLGPIAATGIVLAWAASLSYLPAILALFGRVAFWPAIPRIGRGGQHKTVPLAQDGEPIAGLEENHGVWTKIGAVVARHPRRVWIITASALLVAAAGITQLQASGVAQTDVLLGESDAVSGQRMLEEHFNAGNGSPVTVFLSEEQAEPALELIENLDGVDSAFLTAESGQPAGIPMGGDPLPPAVNDGDVYIQATLSDAADSVEAEHTIVELRDQLHGLDDTSVVGGTTATQLDTNTTAQSDLRIVIPLVLLVVFVVLVVLLRSIIMPALLVAATVLSFATAMSISALVFNHLFQFPGADPTVPLYGFVFLVALGVDYTIFLVTRAREEVLSVGTRAGMLRALSVTGGVITSAGVVLAATFAALSVIPLMFMVQLAFIVAFGVLLDTFIVRTLLVPALTYDLGKVVWWPSKLSRTTRT